MSDEKPVPKFVEHHGYPEEDLREGGDDNPGYFRAWLGMELDDCRFCVVRKLGYGEFSSVWLARDFKYSALKIITREATSDSQAGRTDEIAMLKKISSADRSHPGARHLLEYYDTFAIAGTDGPHCCIVTEALGPSLDNLRRQDKESHCLPLRVCKSVMRQVLLGLDYLHTSCGIIHTDVKFDNILAHLRDMSSVVAQEIVERPSKGVAISIFSDIQSSPYIVKSQPMSLNLASSDSHVEVVIADLGFSHWTDNHFREKFQPSRLRAPEVILGHPWDQDVDIWGIGCLGIEMIAGFTPFESNLFERHIRSIEEDHLAQMTDMTGEQFSLEMLSKSQHRDKFFDESGAFIHVDAPREPAWPLRRFFAECSSFASDEREIVSAVGFFKHCLQLQPKNRATAKELAEDIWLELN